MAVIAAILRAQFLSMRIGRTRGAVFGIVTAVLWYGMWLFVAGAAAIAAAGSTPAQLHRYLTLAFMGLCLYWQFVPILSASMGSSLAMDKLLIYPVPHGRLFLVEVLLRLTTGFEMVLMLAGGLIGLTVNRHVGGGLLLVRALPSMLLFIAFNLLLAAGLRSLLERWLARRNVREFVALFVMLLWMVPRLLLESGMRPHAPRGVSTILQAVAFPWSAAARAALGESAFIAFLGLAAWGMLAWWFGRFQFERSLRYDMVAAQASPGRVRSVRGAALAEAFYRFPSKLWRDPLAGIVEKELRTLLRTPRFRMIFVMGFSFGLMLWLPLIVGRNAARNGTTAEYFLPIVCLYALTLLGQVSYWNAFGFDRSAAGLYFAAPQPIVITLIAKNITHLIFIYLEVLVLTGITMLLPFQMGRGRVGETLVVIGVCALYMLALGNISSVQYPRALSAERVWHGGASSRFQALVFLLYPLALLPVFLAYLARYAFDSNTVFYFALTMAAMLGGGLYWSALRSAVQTARTRREQILLELSKNDGPVVSD